MEFRDLKKQYEYLKDEIDKNINKVLLSSQYISGPQVKELEEKLAEYVGVKHCITCANGTDAISLALLTWNIGPGDAIFVPDFTFFSSGECPALLGATPVFIDVKDTTYNMDPQKLENAVVKIIKEGKYKAKAVVAVDLFGQPAEYDEIKDICNKYNLLLLEDAAQGFGGTIKGKKACSFGDISTTSFFPAKPLGCYGDGGAVFTNNDEWAALIRSYAVHGKSDSDKYNNIRIGLNSRLDTLQAAILLSKFKAFTEYELTDVNIIANWYNEELANVNVKLPVVLDGFKSSWAQYTVRIPEELDREELQQALRINGIPTMVYYMKPMHLQKAFEGTDSAIADCKVTEKLCKTVISLPIHPYMKNEDVKFVSSKINEILKKCNKLID